jgi:multidrug resistance efflux pump
VSGYITAVPVTDNQHVVAGDVIARIDDRDYRIALEQAQAQVANAEASIQNIDAQITGAARASQRERGAGRSSAGRAGVRAAAGYALPGPGAKRRRDRSEFPAIHLAAAPAASGAGESKQTSSWRNGKSRR